MMTRVMKVRTQLANGYEWVRPLEQRGYRARPAGKSTVEARCGFCRTWVVCYPWSLAGSGKRCTCGAILGSFGTRRKVEEACAG